LNNKQNLKEITMKNLILIVATLILIQVCNAQTDSPYFGLDLPGNEPVIFTPANDGLSSTSEMGPMFSSDGNTFFFLRLYWDNNGNFLKREFLYITKEGDSIVGPKLSPYQTSLSIISGNRCFYSDDNCIWKFEITDTGWTVPEKIDFHFDTNDVSGSFLFTYLSVADNENLYYTVYSETSGVTEADLYYSIKTDSGYTKPQHFEYPVNSNKWDQHCYIAPDESYMIYISERTGGYGGADYYITFKKEDGAWTEPINLGSKINSSGGANQAFVTPDGKYFMFDRNNVMYWMSTDFIDDLREIALSTSVKESEGGQIQIFPNPTSQTIQINGIDRLLNKASYKLINLNGKTIKQGKLNSETIDVSELPKGIYMLSLNSNEGIINKKIVIE